MGSAVPRIATDRTRRTGPSGIAADRRRGTGRSRIAADRRADRDDRGSGVRIRMITEPSLPRARGARYLTGLPETMRPAVYCESNQTEQPDERGCYEDA